MKKEKIIAVIGTRPEAIKMFPLINELKRREGFVTEVLSTGQHGNLLSDILTELGAVPDYSLTVKRRGEGLAQLSSRMLESVTQIFERKRPRLVLVHGDTASALAAALAAFYLKIPVGHIEAGLRTGNIHLPFPEEFNRRAISIISELHFAPTGDARDNLIREGANPCRIFTTGNTVVDALSMTVTKDFSHPLLDDGGKKTILLTTHRRESLGGAMTEIFAAVRLVARDFPDIKVIYPVHPNPKIRGLAEAELRGCENVYLTAPLGMRDFHNILARCYLVMTDSGGVQEEACALGKPTLVLRGETERPEGVRAGCLRLVGTGRDGIYGAVRELLENAREYKKTASAENPYGDGHASERIADAICDYLG